MNDSFDLDAYLRRIRWSGSLAPGLDTLARLLRAHMQSIPFENLDVLLGRPIRLDLAGVQAKLVGASRGGYCFEHCALFAAALEALGFEPLRHAARVTLYMPHSAAPRTHMFLSVPLAEGTFVVDPGFGALAPRVPVPLQAGVLARLDSESHWMGRDGRFWVLHAQAGAEPVQAWASTLEKECAADFDLSNHYTSTHPASPFVNRILLRALTDDGRVTVANREFTLRRGSTTQTAQLADRAALRAVLEQYFGFDLPEVEQLAVPSIPEWT